MRGTFLGVSTISSIMFWGYILGSAYFGNLPVLGLGFRVWGLEFRV